MSSLFLPRGNSARRTANVSGLDFKPRGPLKNWKLHISQKDSDKKPLVAFSTSWEARITARCRRASPMLRTFCLRLTVAGDAFSYICELAWCTLLGLLLATEILEVKPKLTAILTIFLDSERLESRRLRQHVCWRAIKHSKPYSLQRVFPANAVSIGLILNSLRHGAPICWSYKIS